MEYSITRDPVTGTIYVYSDYSVHKYNLDHEDKHVWKVFLEKGEFEKGKWICLVSNDFEAFRGLR